MGKRRYGIDEARITRWIKQGRGQGSREAYLPWLTIHDVPSIGRASRFFGKITGREHHLLSDIERSVCLALDAADGVVDIREQFPLAREVTIAIADEMGVPHPRDHGVDIVMTTDFLVDVRQAGGTRQEAIAVKPSQGLDDKRTIEKLEIERRYWLRRGVPWRISTELEISFGGKMFLLWCHSLKSLEHHEAPSPTYWDECCDRVIVALSASDPQPLPDLFRELEKQHGFEPGDALTAIGHLAANGRLALQGTDTFLPRGMTSQLRITAGDADDGKSLKGAAAA